MKHLNKLKEINKELKKNVKVVEARKNLTVHLKIFLKKNRRRGANENENSTESEEDANADDDNSQLENVTHRTREQQLSARGVSTREQRWN